MTRVSITAGPYRRHFELERAPKTCEAFRRHMPFKNKIIMCDVVEKQCR
jgi:hypothetical protein